MLIDHGSTHNFISDRLASILSLPRISTKTIIVRVSNGEQLKCQGHFDKIVVNLQGTKFYLTLFSFPLSIFNLVLNIQRFAIWFVIGNN